MAKKKKLLKKRLFHGKRLSEYEDEAFKYFGMACTLFGIIVLGILLWNVVSEGISRINWDFITDGPSRKAAKAGIYTAWVGTLWILGITSLVAFPIGIGAGLYLEEYNKKSRLASFLEINISNLAGVPSAF